jgi:membrane fusion protein (multidrug efflux system)
MRILTAAFAAVLVMQGAQAQVTLPPLAGEARAIDLRTPAPLPPPPPGMSANGGMECLVEPSMVVSVGSPVDGVLDEVAVNRGDPVRKGQVVARLQSGVETAAVTLSRARVDFGRRKMERSETLAQKQLISTQEKDELVTEVRLREEELKRDEETLKLRTIISPINGVVVERRLVPGEFIRSDKSVVLKLAQIDPLHVEAVVPARFFKTLRVGMPARVSLAPFLPGSYQAQVIVVDKVIDAASGTLGVRLQLPNPDNKIPAGIQCAVVFGK